MTGSVIKRERKARWLALKADPAFAQDCISRIACGDSIRALAVENDIAINTFWLWITQEHCEEVAAARKVVAAQLADQMKESAERVESGELNPKAAQTASSIRQWLASRYDRETFGDKTRVDLNLSSVSQMHYDAIRQFTRETLEGEYTSLDGKQDDENSHPLL